LTHPGTGIDIVIDKLSRAIAIYLAYSGDYSVVDKLAHASRVEDILQALNNVLREMPSAIDAIVKGRKDRMAYDKIDINFLKNNLLEYLARSEYDLSRDIQTLYKELEKDITKVKQYGLRLSSYALGYLTTALIKAS